MRREYGSGNQITLDGLAHHCGVLVMSRTPTGEWTMWRVGRLRLAWRPIMRAPWTPTTDYDPMAKRTEQDVDLLNWLAVLLATPLVWPWRAVTNQWPVIAYTMYPTDGDSRQRRSAPMPRTEADALVREWADHIKQYGEPPPQGRASRSSTG
jgi:hypothetical protein